MTDSYAISVYRTEVSELVAGQRISAKAAWVARSNLTEAEKALNSPTADWQSDYFRRVDQVAKAMQAFEDALR